MLTLLIRLRSARSARSGGPELGPPFDQILDPLLFYMCDMSQVSHKKGRKGGRRLFCQVFRNLYFYHSIMSLTNLFVATTFKIAHSDLLNLNTECLSAIWKMSQLRYHTVQCSKITTVCQY